MKLAKDMTDQERQAALAEIKRGEKPEPVSAEKRATEMSAHERAEYLAEHKKRFGL
jgi:hypothetical protein